MTHGAGRAVRDDVGHLLGMEGLLDALCAIG